VLVNDPQLRQGVEGLAHGLRKGLIGLRNDVHCHIDAQLHGARQIQRQDVLSIDVRAQLLRRFGPLLLHPGDAPPKGLELFFQDQCIHAFLR